MIKVFIFTGLAVGGILIQFGMPLVGLGVTVGVLAAATYPGE